MGRCALYPRRPRRGASERLYAGGPRLSRPYPRRARSEVKSRGVMREGRACRGRTRAGPVRTPYAESPPPHCLRFQCVIKSRPLPEPPSLKALSPRQSDIVGRKGHNIRKAFAASAAPPSPRLLGSDGKSG